MYELLGTNLYNLAAYVAKSIFLSWAYYAILKQFLLTFKRLSLIYIHTHTKRSEYYRYLQNNFSNGKPITFILLHQKPVYGIPTVVDLHLQFT